MPSQLYRHYREFPERGVCNLFGPPSSGQNKVFVALFVDGFDLLGIDLESIDVRRENFRFALSRTQVLGLISVTDFIGNIALRKGRLR